jgi:hypothetical protein
MAWSIGLTCAPLRPAVGNMVGQGGFLPSADLDNNGVIDIRYIGGYRGCCLRARIAD